MVILFVHDDWTIASNGTVMTGLRFATELRNRGHEVRFLGKVHPGVGNYNLKERYIPIISRVSKKQDVVFARPDKKIILEALKGVNVVHCFMPWKISYYTAKLAKKMGITVTTAFHTHPLNITYGIGGLAMNSKLLQKFIFWRWKKTFYRHFDNVHCPSYLCVEEMRKAKYHNKCHVISNGCNSNFYPDPNYQPNFDKDLKIIMVGRFANEKRQDLLIKAISKSQHRDHIIATLVGRGPNETKLANLAKALGVNITVSSKILSKDEMRSLLHSHDLYVHCAEIEIEGMTCIEAFSSGLPCLIGNSPLSATKQFSISEETIFKGGDALDLAKKIDYFFEHRESLITLRQQYLEQAKHYQIAASIDRFLEMIKEATADKLITINTLKTKSGKKMLKKIRVPLLFRFLSGLLYYGLAFPVIVLFLFFGYRFKVKGLTNLRKIHKLKTGAVSISNHIHNLDSAMVALSSFPRKAIITAQPANFKLPVAGLLVNALQAVPTPTSVDETKTFFYGLGKKVQNKKIVHFFPEGKLVKYDIHLREFKKGAFLLASQELVPILPMYFSYGYNKKGQVSRVTLNIGKPIFPNPILPKEERTQDLMEASLLAMQQLSNWAYN
ncbi:MAG: glycosyltransferase [Acholeplasmatales bacterium]|jgi:glycosyltransferase involved in cell wall biosynthesis/1-acyl-sn-glycerol-3-phosphate acyltransferase|nr:glycosyltransferase [Acholeplasmatales bacterium]